MKERKILTFYSWRNLGKDVRAIALCETNKPWFFAVAINCLRDDDMFGVNSDGVYNRQWANDYVWTEELTSMRPATENEIRLYMKYVKVHDAVDGFGKGTKQVKVIKNFCDINGVHMGIELTDMPVWKQVINYFKH